MVLEVPLDRETEAAAVRHEDAKPNGTQFRITKAEIAKPESDVRVFWVGFAQEPGGTAVRCEELDHRVVVDGVLASFDAGRSGAAVPAVAQGGDVVGFDADGPDVFDLQYNFIMENALANTAVAVLTAIPKNTPTHPPTLPQQKTRV